MWLGFFEFFRTIFFVIREAVTLPANGLELAWVNAPQRTLLLCCLILFLETGCILFPFLPGDTFLATIGSSLAVKGQPTLIPMLHLMLAAFLGSVFNYFVGFYMGHSLHRKLSRYRWYQKSMEQAEPYLKKHGSFSIFFSRWIPWVRTFSPFIAGVFTLPPSVVIFYNFLGAIFWVGALVSLGAWTPGAVEIFSTLMVVGALLTPVSALLYVTGAWLKRQWDKKTLGKKGR